MSRRTVLVTGAAGTVGTYVVALAGAAGHRVIASDLRARTVRVPVRGEVREADLTDPSAIRELVRGCDAVIHTAALLDVGAGQAALAAVNTDAVAALYEAAEAASAKHFVHLSGARLYAAHGPAPLREDAPLAPRGPYGMSKHAAEVFLRGQKGLPWTILRAAPIYGRRGRHFAASLLAVGPILRLTSPLLPRFEGGPMGTMTHAEDVARALLFVLGNEGAHGQVFNVTDGDARSLGERLSITFDAYGLRTAPVPSAFSSYIGMLGSERLNRVLDRAALTGWKAVTTRHGLKSALRPRFDPEVLELVHEDLVVDGTKLEELGFEPRFPRFEAGWSEVLRVYQAEGWVPRY
ncbi:MAG: NAD(P)-dependent oxidoreductase [Myxococcota bacterium]